MIVDKCSKRASACILTLVSLSLLVAGCKPLPESSNTTVGSPSSPAQATLPYITPYIPTSITDVVNSLVDTLYVSDPDLPQYDPNSNGYAQFPEVVKQLGSMGTAAADGADDLAVAITFPRPDLYLAAQALLALGPDLIAIDLPILIGNLQDQKPEARIYSAILLASAGKPASCAVGHIGPLLWDSDPYLRSAAAIALEKITGEDLVASQYEIVITPAFLADKLAPDIPQGSVTGRARAWWTDSGSKINWHPSYDLCDG